MKKYLMFILLVIPLVLGACGSSMEESNSDDSTDTETTDKETTDKETAEKQDTHIQNETVTPEEQEQEEPKEEESELLDIQLNSETNKIELVHPDGTTEVLAENNPSEPVKSPNGEKAAYISPKGWEELSELYIVDLQDGSQEVLVSHDNENKPKNVIWEDDKHVLAIIGYPHGTVAVGGNIYRVNVETGEQEQITDYDGNTQITDLRLEDGVLHYSGIRYTDDIQNEHEDYSNEITLEKE
ncbi:DUF4652 domain-containing protein [Oceanobacillus senegalensis]|uniref:DUF4652 domain-containing protein n=1 Tax=Oceanobacillus senegalensis TaxID=1936063 RepID=UPI0015C47C56|nr:DUF4652 domain-containing protein [Oceanobacillus senegalensis]